MFAQHDDIIIVSAVESPDSKLTRGLLSLEAETRPCRWNSEDAVWLFQLWANCWRCFRHHPIRWRWGWTTRGPQEDQCHVVFLPQKKRQWVKHPNCLWCGNITVFPVQYSTCKNIPRWNHLCRISQFDAWLQPCNVTLCITYVRITYNLDNDTFIMFKTEEICERSETSPPAGQNVQRDTRLPAGGKRPAGGAFILHKKGGMQQRTHEQAGWLWMRQDEAGLL